MNKVIERQANFLVDHIANSTGRTVDTLYASFVHKLGLTQPFFKVSDLLMLRARVTSAIIFSNSPRSSVCHPQAGWGDLNVVDLNEGAKLLEEWPPAHFDVKVYLPTASRELTLSSMPSVTLSCLCRFSGRS